MSTLKTPFKYDFVGSFLRPQALKDAKSKYKNNEISQEEYDKIVNYEITKLVAKQKELGYHAITDGEFRRTFWHLDFMWGFGGVEHKDTGNGVPFNAELAVLDDTYLVGKIKAKPHPFVEYFKFLKQFEDENTVAKYTIPAPAQTYLQFIVPSNIESTRKYYPTNEELIADIAAAYKDVIKQFYDAGCRNLQLDDCSWGSVIGENANADVFGLSADEFKEQLLTVNNLALEGKADVASMHLEAAGQIARDASKAVIEAGDRLTPLSGKTIKKRREMKPPIPGDKPLRARGFLFRAIQYVVRKK